MSGSAKNGARSRKEQVAARSRTASPAATPGTPTPFQASTLYIVGAVLVLVAVAVLIVLVLKTAGGGDLRDFSGGESWGDNTVAAPFIILMLASAPLFLAEYHRRGQWSSRNRGFFEGGSNVIELRPARLWTRFLFIALCVAGWVALIAVPVYLDITSDVFADANENLWTVLVLYGFFSSGMAAVLLFSLLKRLTYDRFADRGAIVYGSFSQLFWRFVSYRFRLELWFAFGCGAILGTIPLVYQAAAERCYTASCTIVPDPAWLSWITWIAVGTGVIALLGCLNAWRSGKSLYSGESTS